jgi:hypothetical protein
MTNQALHRGSADAEGLERRGIAAIRVAYG